MKLLISLALLGSMLSADSVDLVRNQKLQKAAAAAQKTQETFQTFLESWQADCKHEDKQLRAVGFNLIGCVAVPAPPTPKQEKEAKHE